MKIILLSILVLLTSCGSIPEDSSTAPVDAGLYSVEMRSSCGLDVGLHGCMFKTGEDLKEKYLSVPVSFKGEFEIVSDRCNFSEKFNFEDQDEIKYSWAELTEKKSPGIFACLFSIRVKFDKVRSMMGQFLLSDAEEFGVSTIHFLDKTYAGVASFQLPLDMVSDPEFTFPDANLVVFKGCGVDGQVNGNAVKLSALAPQKKDCLIEVGAFGDGVASIGTINLKFYERTYVDLPVPVITYKNERLAVDADDVVLITSINGAWKKGNKLTKKVANGETAWVRVLTSNGRFKLLGVKDGEIVWTSSKR